MFVPARSSRMHRQRYADDVNVHDRTHCSKMNCMHGDFDIENAVDANVTVECYARLNPRDTPTMIVPPAHLLSQAIGSLVRVIVLFEERPSISRLVPAHQPRLSQAKREISHLPSAPSFALPPSPSPASTPYLPSTTQAPSQTDLPSSQYQPRRA